MIIGENVSTTDSFCVIRSTEAVKLQFYFIIVLVISCFIINLRLVRLGFPESAELAGASKVLEL